MLRKLFFSLWYLLKPPWDTGTSPPELMDFIENNPPGRALDLGCGTGTNVITLAKHGWDAVGVDFAHRAIKIARKKAEKEDLETTFYVDNVTNLKHVAGTFDLLLDMGCYHSIPNEDRRDYLDQLRSLIASNGTFMLYTFLKTDPNQTGTGIDEADIRLISQSLNLIERKDGSERGIRPSTWLIFRN